MPMDTIGDLPTVQADARAPADPATPAAARVQSRNLYFNAGGQVILRAPLAGVTPFTPVAVSITEVDAGGHPFIGGARMTVNNVRAYQDGVDTRVTIEFDRDLRVRVSYLWT